MSLLFLMAGKRGLKAKVRLHDNLLAWIFVLFSLPQIHLLAVNSGVSESLSQNSHFLSVLENFHWKLGILIHSEEYLIEAVDRITHLHITFHQIILHLKCVSLFSTWILHWLCSVWFSLVWSHLEQEAFKTLLFKNFAAQSEFFWHAQYLWLVIHSCHHTPIISIVYKFL